MCFLCEVFNWLSLVTSTVAYDVMMWLLKALCKIVKLKEGYVKLISIQLEADGGRDESASVDPAEAQSHEVRKREMCLPLIHFSYHKILSISSFLT